MEHPIKNPLKCMIWVAWHNLLFQWANLLAAGCTLVFLKATNIFRTPPYKGYVSHLMVELLRLVDYSNLSKVELAVNLQFQLVGSQKA